jgi:hypothetical protein
VTAVPASSTSDTTSDVTEIPAAARPEHGRCHRGGIDIDLPGLIDVAPIEPGTVFSPAPERRAPHHDTESTQLHLPRL